MTLLITIFAAVISTVVWYVSDNSGLKTGSLCLMYWGASLMWLVDAIAEYIEMGAEFFTPSAGDMLNDAYLGFSAVALGLVIWLVITLIKDPKGKLRAVLTNKN